MIGTRGPQVQALRRGVVSAQTGHVFGRARQGQAVVEAALLGRVRVGVAGLERELVRRLPAPTQFDALNAGVVDIVPVVELIQRVLIPAQHLARHVADAVVVGVRPADPVVGDLVLEVGAEDRGVQRHRRDRPPQGADLIVDAALGLQVRIADDDAAQSRAIVAVGAASFVGVAIGHGADLWRTEAG
ncbi:hypothetical protein D3C86_1434060 [compost metagenome]